MNAIRLLKIKLRKRKLRGIDNWVVSAGDKPRLGMAHRR